MQLKLPTLPWKSKGWTLTEQLEKVREEYLELRKAVLYEGPHEIAQECLDLAQTADTALSMIMDKYPEIFLENELEAHYKKLVRKGYME